MKTKGDEEREVRAVALQNAGAILVARQRAEHDLLRAKEELERKTRQLEEKTRILEVLQQTGRTLASNLDIESLVQSVTDAATEVIGAEFGAFFYNVTDESGDAYMLYTLSGVSREAFAGFGQPRATPLFGPTFRGEGVIRLDDVQADPRYGQWGPHHGMPSGHPPVRSYLAVPVRSRNGSVLGGLFFGHSRTGVFGESAEQLVVGIADQASVAMDNAHLFEEAHEAAAERLRLLESERTARAEVERASELKDEFLATVSHELRTPLGAMLGWTQILQLRPMSAEELKHGLSAIERNARAQTQLVEDLLDMSRITSGTLRLDVQPVYPAAFIEPAVETVRPAASAKDIRIEVVLDPHAGPITGDVSRLQQVVWNLLSNAIKFTPKGGRVQVRLRRVGSQVEVSVADSGIGIAPEFLPYVFERFRQADGSPTRAFGGLGLGLAIVKRLVELHGGSVEAHSEGVGQGACFSVQLPVALIPYSTAKGERAHARTSLSLPVPMEVVDLSGVRILVVDDDPDTRDMLGRVLTECGAEVERASNSVEALAVVEREPPDLLVCDIGMPNVDGYELLRMIRRLERERGGRLPAIALTALARSEDRTRALRAGFLVHIAKPVEPAELVATVASVTGRVGGSD
jgi:signal transduction histidine kinase/CheY-like chemotaxis protein